nr:ATP-binding protein [Thermomonospora umbrina]
MARGLATETLNGHSLPAAVVENAALVVSELVTNGLRASVAGGAVGVELVPESTDGSVVVGVWDAKFDLPPEEGVNAPDVDSVALPDMAGLEEGRNGGWGLPMVDALVARRWVRQTTSPAGKWVYAALATPAGIGWASVDLWDDRWEPGA